MRDDIRQKYIGIQDLESRILILEEHFYLDQIDGINDYFDSEDS